MIWEIQHHSLTIFLGCTQRQCEPNQNIVDKCRTLVESRVSAGATEKLPSCKRGSTCPHFSTRLHRRDTSLTPRNAMRTGLALWHTITWMVCHTSRSRQDTDGTPVPGTPGRPWVARPQTRTRDGERSVQHKARKIRIFPRDPKAWKVVPRRARKGLSNWRTKPPLNNSSKYQLRALMTISSKKMYSVG